MSKKKGKTAKSNGADIIVPVIDVSHGTYKKEEEYEYLSLKSHELVNIGGMIAEYYDQVGLPELASNLYNFYKERVEGMVRMETAEYIVALRKGWSYPVKEADVMGFIYMFVLSEYTADSTTDKIPVLFIDSIKTKRKYMPNLLKGLINKAIFLARRYKTQEVHLEARNPILQRLWHDMGFRSFSVRMKFKGDADAFIQQNTIWDETITKIQEKENGQWIETKAGEQTISTADSSS